MPDVLTQKTRSTPKSISPIDFGQAITQAISLVLSEVQFNRNTITQYRNFDFVRRSLNGRMESLGYKTSRRILSPTLLQLLETRLTGLTSELHRRETIAFNAVLRQIESEFMSDILELGQVTLSGERNYVLGVVNSRIRELWNFDAMIRIPEYIEMRDELVSDIETSGFLEILKEASNQLSVIYDNNLSLTRKLADIRTELEREVRKKWIYIVKFELDAYITEEAEGLYQKYRKLEDLQFEKLIDDFMDLDSGLIRVSIIKNLALAVSKESIENMLLERIEGEGINIEGLPERYKNIISDASQELFDTYNPIFLEKYYNAINSVRNLFEKLALKNADILRNKSKVNNFIIEAFRSNGFQITEVDGALNLSILPDILKDSILILIEDYYEERNFNDMKQVLTRTTGEIGLIFNIKRFIFNTHGRLLAEMIYRRTMKGRHGFRISESELKEQLKIINNPDNGYLNKVKAACSNFRLRRRALDKEIRLIMSDFSNKEYYIYLGIKIKRDKLAIET